jgi:DNA modification methylase
MTIKGWQERTRSGVEWTLYNGDAVEVLQTLKPGTVDVIVTSPPYYCLRDYKVEGQIGLEDTVEEYVTVLCTVMDDLYRVLSKDGLLFLNLGDTYYSGKGRSSGADRKSRKRRFGVRPVDKSGGLGLNLQRKSIIGVPYRVILRMIERKWILRSSIIWCKDKVLPEAVLDRPRRSYEYVFMFAKDRKYYFNRDALVNDKYGKDIWIIPVNSRINKDIDTASFPQELVERCLKIGCKPKGLVLDPFVGSGTTMFAAIKAGYSTIGIDLNLQCCNYIKENLRKVS